MKRASWVAFKILVTAALLAVLLFRIDLAAVADALGNLGLTAAVMVPALTVVAVGVSAWRWHRVLAHLGERVPFTALLADTLVGTTYNLLLPTSVGGDVARGIRSAKRVVDAEHAWASVMFERVLGLLSLVVVSMIGLLHGLTRAFLPLLLGALGMVVVLAAGLVFAPAPLRLAARITELGKARPEARSLSAFLERLARAFAGPLSTSSARLETLGWSFLYQFVALSVLLPVGWHWQGPELLRAIYLGVPIALVASTLPISLGGHGLRESLFVVVLQPFGLSSERAFALSLVWLAANVFVGLIGLAVMLLEKR